MLNSKSSIQPLPDLPLTLEGVRIERLLDGKSLPVIVHPTKQGIDLTEWAKMYADFIDNELVTSGAILFRGFGPASVDSFRCFTDAVFDEYMGYEMDLAHRPEISNLIYKSTLIPAEKFMCFHNDCAAQRKWPLRIALCCKIMAQRGGETPLADCRKIYSRLVPEIREKFARLGVQYTRGISKAELKRVFRSNSKPTIEAYCQDNDYEFEWDSQGGVRIRFVAQAITAHPVSKEPVWFTPVHAYLGPRYPYIYQKDPIPSPIAALPVERGTYDLDAYYGDGSPIDDETVFHIHNAHALEAIEFPWQAGDILLLDNMLITHGRNSFEGDREVMLAMGNPYRSKQAHH